MFTGLIEGVGAVVGLRRSGGGARLSIQAPMAAELAPGESIAVDGVCLTVAAPPKAGTFVADLSGETLRRTRLGAVRRGRQVNLERSLLPTSRLGGHFVQGHVDGLVRVVGIRRSGSFREFRFTVPEGSEPQLVEKGSVAIDGISLTVAELARAAFSVAVIPETLARTNLRDRRVGDDVHVEWDMIGKYVLRALALGSRRA